MHPLDNQEALLITNLANLDYLTGFSGSHGAGLFTDGQLMLFTDSRYYDAARQQCFFDEIVQASGSLEITLSQVLADKRIKTLYVEQSLSLERWQRFREQFAHASLQPVASPLEFLRSCKDHLELDLIRNSIHISITAFERISSCLRPGTSEREIAAELEYQCRRLGADSQAFSTIVAWGPGSAVPHHQTGANRVEQGGNLLMDWGAKAHYCSDMTRTFFFEKPQKQMEEIYRIVLEAQLAAIEQLKPGVKLIDVDAAARSVITDYGFGEFFGHGTGHSLGIEIHEHPTISPRSGDAIAEPGMVLTVEPGIYLPGSGGVRIEDVVLVTPTGNEVLTSALPKGLESAVL
ncbi:Xaa-Pro aminopeptidase [Desulfurispira natronophila]|uniref:Xaa-Pro aminopeptidase n=1 Tax=Desulfurispira natronophila TaxID=682562 RepID=A0A7W7Y5Q2_9BACT|nr:Xaa-Pro aminopeptidase [Desulfurispira natronophila]